MEKGVIVIGTIGRDCHVIGQWVLTKFFEQRGFKVIKLGNSVSQQEFVDAAIETDADAIFVSSLYGMGFLDSQGLREKLIESGKENVVLYVGGILSVGSESVWKNTEEQWGETEQKFKEIGFDRVYSRDAKLEDVLKDLNEDLKVRRSRLKKRSGESRATGE